ncbi:MAG: 3-oxoacyl-ACP reductase FabG [Firmicutes bacterium]|nr:3-oxoacyl-ACP reductase FabG [Bacillota bacterium]
MAKTVLITGGTRGIGRACAERFMSDGYNVAVIYKADEHSAADMRREGYMAVKADIAEREQVADAVRLVADAFGVIDVLVCNAGISYIAPVLGTEPERADRLINVNLGGVMQCCREALPHIIERRGAIVTVSSMWGQVGASCEAYYSAAKAGVIGWTKALAKELGPSGVRVNCVAPGVIDTDMNAGLDADTVAQLCAETPLGRMGTAADVAAAVAFLSGDDSRFITGQVLGVNGGLII